MRYRDAGHIDTGSFFARRSCAGGPYRLAGHVGAVAAAIARPEDLGWVAVALIAVWLSGWFQVVGTLWRSSLVSGIAICAARLALVRCGVHA